MMMERFIGITRLCQRLFRVLSFEKSIGLRPQLFFLLFLLGLTPFLLLGLTGMTTALAADDPYSTPLNRDGSELMVNVEGLNETSSPPFISHAAGTMVCTAGLTSYWHLDETSGSTYDDAQGSNDGACGGINGSDCPIPATGKINGGQAFTGTQRINVPDDDSLDWENSDSFSIEVWVQTTQDCTGNKVFAGKKENGGAEGSWWVGCGDDTTDNVAAFFLRDDPFNNDPKAEIRGTTPINDGSWHHIVAVRDSSAKTNYLYVDANLERQQAISYTGHFSNTNPLNLGHYKNDFYFQGTLDEAAVYDRALTPSEIEQHYNSGTGLAYCGVTPEITSSPVVTGIVGQIYDYTVTATGSPTPTYGLTTKPDEMTINAATGVISWTPTTTGTHGVTVEANNTWGSSDPQSFDIEVALVPTITSSPVTSGIVGQAYNYDVAATGYPAPTYELTTKPEGMTIITTTGVISWTPTVTGTYSVTVEASNSADTDSQSFSIDISDDTSNVYLPIIMRN